MKKTDEKCPRCGTLLEIAHKTELYCSKCISYKIDGIWQHIWCDEYHRHGSDCLVVDDRFKKF